MVPRVIPTDQPEIADLETGPASGRPVLLHGFPDDATGAAARSDEPLPSDGNARVRQ